MGEYAEAALWAEMNGRDPGDMSPEDWSDFYDESKPCTASEVHFEAVMFLSHLDDHTEGEEGARAGVLMAMFPDLGEAHAKALVAGLEAIKAMPEPEDDED